MTHKNALLFLVIILIMIMPITCSSPSRGECLTDRNCSPHHKCVNKYCFHVKEHVFKCVSDLHCPEFHVCRNSVCLMEKKTTRVRKFRRHLNRNRKVSKEMMLY